MNSYSLYQQANPNIKMYILITLTYLKFEILFKQSAQRHRLKGKTKLLFVITKTKAEKQISKYAYRNLLQRNE